MLAPPPPPQHAGGRHSGQEAHYSLGGGSRTVQLEEVMLLVQLFKDIIVGNPDYNRINSKYTVTSVLRIRIRDPVPF
jgi:hypothetical protein